MNIIEKLLQNILPLEIHDVVILGILMSIIIICSVIIIGAIVNKLEQLEMQLLSSRFGFSFANICCNYLTFPGVIIHELSHALFGSLAGAKIIEIKCFEFGQNGRLGHVTYRLRGNPIQQALQHSLCACAPVITGILIEGGILYVLNGNADLVFGLKILLIYLFISVFNHMSMSKEDIKNYCKGLWVILPIAFILSALCTLHFIK